MPREGGYDGPAPFLDMTVKAWLDAAIQDADRRGLTSLKPLLEALARSTSALRTADWNLDASGEPLARDAR
jgi:hypothetical protein